MAGKARQVELSISCQDLYKADTFSKSDPRVRVYEENHGQWVLRGETEKIDNDQSPVFKTRIPIEYRFEDRQNLRFVVTDVDGNKEQSLGEMECRLTQLLSGSFTKELEHPQHKKGKIIVSADEVSSCEDTIKIQFSGAGLSIKDTFSRSSDPFLTLYRTREGASPEHVAETEVKENTLSPTWDEAVYQVRDLCNGDYYRPIRVVCQDSDDGQKKKKVEYMGEFTFTLSNLEKGGRHKKTFTLLNAQKGNKEVGTITLDYEITKNYTFTQYLKGGCEISMMVAVDFTGSNGDPNDPDSLHYRKKNNDNQYEQVMKAVSSVLSQYDSDGNFPAYGFGARIPDHDETSHAFPLNFNWDNPEVCGVDGILTVYEDALSKITLSGPTIFQQILQNLQGYATPKGPFARPDGSKYYVLVIMTDGEITDMENTIRELIACSRLPCSVIILGIGDGGDSKFAKMKALDGDGGLLRIGGQEAVRDIVQFVKTADSASVTSVCSEALREVPEQLVSYMRNNQITPGK